MINIVKKELEFHEELHEEEIIDDDDLEIIQNEYSIYGSKDDDLER